MADAVLETDDLPLHALQLAGAAQRDQRLDRLVLHGVPQFAPDALAQVDQGIARRATDALGGVQRHLYRGAAIRAAELPAAFFLRAFFAQASQAQVLQAHRLAAGQLRRLR